MNLEGWVLPVFLLNSIEVFLIFNIVLTSAIQQSDSVIHIPILFSCFFPLWSITGYWIEFPVLYSRTSLFIHPICNSLHLLIPNLEGSVLYNIINIYCCRPSVVLNLVKYFIFVYMKHVLFFPGKWFESQPTYHYHMKFSLSASIRLSPSFFYSFLLCKFH